MTSSLEERIQDLENQLEYQKDTLSDALDTSFLLVCAIFVFMMQFGFAALEVGSIRAKNTKAVLLKNITDAAIGALIWWLLGHGAAFGQGSSSSNGFIGTGGLAFSPKLSASNASALALEYARWMLQWAFASTSTTIVSGAIAERVALHAYLLYAVVIASLIYPVVAHWAWAVDSWASANQSDEDDLLLGCGVADFSGSGVVHLTGGLMALVAAIMTRARGGRFDAQGRPCKIQRQSPTLNTLGTLVLWAGWFFFNASGVASFSEQPDSAAKSMLNTAVCPSASVVATLVLHSLYHKSFDPFIATNGVLGGLVAITASSPMVDTEGSFVIGLVSGVLVYFGHWWLVAMKIDDVVDASIVHGLCGLWGMISTGLFTTKDGYARAYNEDRADTCCGSFYGCGGRLLAANMVFMAAQLVWVGGCALILFGLIKFTLGLRITDVQEEEGMDKTTHGRNSTGTALEVTGTGTLRGTSTGVSMDSTVRQQGLLA